MPETLPLPSERFRGQLVEDAALAAERKTPGTRVEVVRMDALTLRTVRPVVIDAAMPVRPDRMVRVDLLERRRSACLPEAHFDIRLVDLEHERGGCEDERGELVPSPRAGVRARNVRDVSAPPSGLFVLDAGKEGARPRRLSACRVRRVEAPRRQPGVSGLRSWFSVCLDPAGRVHLSAGP